MQIFQFSIGILNKERGKVYGKKLKDNCKSQYSSIDYF